MNRKEMQAQYLLKAKNVELKCPKPAEVKKRMLEYIMAGAPVKQALIMCGVPMDVIANWFQLAKSRLSSKNEEIWFLIRDARVMEQKFKWGLVSHIVSDEDWKAKAWFLERKYRQEFGKETTVKVSQVSSLSDDELNQQLKQLEPYGQDTEQPQVEDSTAS